ncbi:dienelactone hydrolase family protein [Rhizobium sp. CG5]|uniref:dienelactone hydrolase family protein n=1 Tax=Rhizobium sp. CG5 TaxID=2726076 RepID=UPI0020332D16|nr:dienelactone hydrolase family protein [Rhizobium sp. CG5]MCM2472407.1 dienelactone hydrolase family protein [Rhizobium sp. CG5]
MQGVERRYDAGGVECVGYYAAGDSAAKVGILLLHEAPGLGPHMRRRADLLAGLGYHAFAADLHGGGQLVQTPAEARVLVGALKADPDLLMARVEGGLRALTEASRLDVEDIAVAGYCFGGWCGLEFARTGVPVRNVSVFHGGLTSERGAAALKTSVLVCVGDADPFSPMDQIRGFQEEMSSAGVDYQLCLFGGVGHGFTDPDIHGAGPGFGYSAKADAGSWSAFVTALGQTPTA